MAAPVAALALAAPYPNPSDARSVRLEFTLPAPGSAQLELYDVAGRRVWSHDMGSLPAGRHGADWSGRDAAGRMAPAGVYFVRLRTSVGDKRATLVRLDWRTACRSRNAERAAAEGRPLCLPRNAPYSASGR